MDLNPTFSLRLLLSLLFLSIAMFAPRVVVAQTEAGEIEEIIITARKFNESLQDAPITVNVITETQLRDAGVTQTGDYIQMIPNVSLADSQTIGTSFLTVRGLSRVRNGELPVAVVVDDVLIINARQFTSQIFDVEQIEFVKGPQGAIYGRNASNGAVVIRTKKPSMDGPEGYLNLSYGKASEYGVEGSYSNNLTDNLGFRLTGRLVERDGYFKNVTLGDETDPYSDRTLRGRLLWEASDTLSMDFKAEVSDHEGKAIGFHWPGAVTFEEFGLFVGTGAELGVTAEQVTAEGANLTGLPYVANNPDRGTREIRSYSLKIDKSFDWFDFKSATTYDEMTLSSVADQGPYRSVLSDGTQHSYVDVEGWSQEIRFTSNSDGPVRWQVGAYYLDWERLRTTAIGIDLGRGIIPVTTVPEFEGSSNPTGVEPGNFLSFLEDSYAYAYFGSVDWDLSEQLTLSLAARYDSETRKQNINPYNTAGRVYSVADANGVNNPYEGNRSSCTDMMGQPKPGAIPDVNCRIYTNLRDLYANTRLASESNKRDYDEFQPKISVSYAMTDTINVYASWGIGYRAGQFNYPGIEVISLTAGEAIDQEKNDSWEIGLKAQLPGFRFNAAYFMSDVDNTQYFPFDGVAFVQIFEDIDKGELDGFELEAYWSPTAWLDLYAAYGATNGEIKAYAERPMTVGNDLPYIPEETFNLGGRVQWNLGNNLTAFARVDYERRGEQYWTPENMTPRDALDLVNTRVGIEGDGWSAALYVNNATDEKYNSEVVTPLFLHPAAPRVWRVETRFEF